MAGFRKTGFYENASLTGETVAAFVPFPLPPKNPPLALESETASHVKKVEQKLGILELAGGMVPSLEWFIYAFVRREAVISSQMEGTQATLMDLLNFEAESPKKASGTADIEEVCNYLDALKYARHELHKSNGLPLSIRLLNQMHYRLMHGSRGKNKSPGTIRKSQNWIGGSRPGVATFGPPPPHVLGTCLGDFEKFIHAKSNIHPLIRVALLHVQFETIHPYLDGNGRLGRLLITLLFEHWDLQKQPLLYLSLYFKRNRETYYEKLGLVRTKGDWEGWIDFFLRGVDEIASEATQLAQDLFALITVDRQKVLQANKSTVMALRLFECLPLHPMVTMPGTVKLLKTTKPTAIKAIEKLLELNILIERTGRKRDRTFGYAAYLKKLESGTELGKAR